MEPPRGAESGTLKKQVFNFFGRFHVQLYQLSGGRLGGKLYGVPVLLLDHIGRKSGAKRTTPLLYGRQGDSVIVIGSNGGSLGHPAWLLNVRDAGKTTIQIGSERSERTVRILEGEERAAAWKLMAGLYPPFDLYQQRADESGREIQVVSLDPA